jgi:hypothetical protein
MNKAQLKLLIGRQLTLPPNLQVCIRIANGAEWIAAHSGAFAARNLAGAELHHDFVTGGGREVPPELQSGDMGIVIDAVEAAIHPA